MISSPQEANMNNSQGGTNLWPVCSKTLVVLLSLNVGSMVACDCHRRTSGMPDSWFQVYRCHHTGQANMWPGWPHANILGNQDVLQETSLQYSMPGIHVAKNFVTDLLSLI